MAGRDEFYLFTMPGDQLCPVWSEMFGQDGLHVVAPTPYSTVDDALEYLAASNPGAIVDELCVASEIDECREWARTRPLERISK